MKKYLFKKYTKKSGSLIPFSLKKEIPFKTKRIFIIYGNKNFVRGNHAHYKCKPFRVPKFDWMEIKYKNKKGSHSINKDYKKKRGILLQPKTWCRIKFKTKKCILMVFCNREYEFSDYIENYKDFLKLI